jgi:tetratricopeptide (TPR) repeat protein
MWNEALRKREIAIGSILTCSILLAGVLSLAGPGAVRADVPQPPDLGGRIDPATFDLPAIQKAYRKILARWASGGRGEAVNELKALELGVVGADGKGRQRLWKAELQAVRELEEAQHESLLPVMVLHQESYAAYRDLHNPYLSLHARDFTQSLAEVYATRSPTEGAKISAARVLTSLGSYMGALFEKSGRYPSAVKFLTRLVKAHPGQAEGKLRLALSLERDTEVIHGGTTGSGNPVEVKRLLRELIGGDTPGWVRNLAYQELAIRYSRDGQFEKAEAVLKEAVAKFPNDPRLYVELASVLERRGQSGTASRMAEKAGSLPPSHEESARFRYSRWAPEALFAMRASLRETSDARLALLSQALGTGKAAG